MSENSASPFSSEIEALENNFNKAKENVTKAFDSKERLKFGKEIEELKKAIETLQNAKKEKQEQYYEVVRAARKVEEVAELKLHKAKAKEIAKYMNSLHARSLKEKIFLALKKYGFVSRYVLTDAILMLKTYKESTAKTMVSQTYTDGAYKMAFKVSKQEETEFTAK